MGICTSLVQLALVVIKIFRISITNNYKFIGGVEGQRTNLQKKQTGKAVSVGNRRKLYMANIRYSLGN